MGCTKIAASLRRFTSPGRAWGTWLFDYQLVNHPAYNVDRGPVHVFGFRLHTQI
jgi:hypothetical protein